MSEEISPDIISGCRKGERTAQHVLYQHFSKTMFYVCLRYARDSDEAKDYLHDGFLRVFEKIRQYDEKGSLEGWIRRLMVNNAIDTLRRNKKFHFNEEQDYEQTDNEEENEEPDYLQISPDKVMEMMQKLSPVYKTVFNLYVFENCSHQEIAQKLNISVGTSKSNLSKARQNLKRLLTAAMEGHEEHR